MDISAIEQRLESLKSKPKPKYEKIDYTKYFWKPKLGKQVIRIVPLKENPKSPFKEVFIHYGITKFPILALTNWGEKDPIVEFCAQLKKSSVKEDWQLANKLSPKMRVFVPVVVRGEEHLGTRLWDFGKTMYTELMGIAADEDIGDYTSITNGRDFTVDTVGPEVTNTPYNKSSIRVKTKTSPITEDKVLLDKILNEQPDVLKVYSKLPYDTIKEHLQTFLTPSTEEENTETEATEVVADESDAQPSTKKTAANKFDDLFSK